MAALTDQLSRPLEDLRISVIDRCNFRCPYCMPAELFTEDHAFVPRASWLSFDQIERVARCAAKLGVRKLRLTGGEPLLRPMLDDLIERLQAIEGIEDLALTTNGLLLPRWGSELKAAGLDRITVSLDALDPGVFHRMSGGKGSVEEVLAGIAAAEAAGFATIKINVVVQRGVNDHLILKTLEHFRFSGHIVRMIEFMDVGNRNGWDRGAVVPSAELHAQVHDRWPLEALESHVPGETARRYRFRDGGGEIGFISSVSKPFCGDCSRARLTCDGTLFTCLFASEGLDLRPHLQPDGSDAGLLEVLRDTWARRRDRYSAERQELKVRTEKIEMYKMGG